MAERANLVFDNKKAAALAVRAKKAGKLGEALVNYSHHLYGREQRAALWAELTALYGKDPTEIKTEAEFWHPKLAAAFSAIAGPKFAVEMHRVVQLHMRCQFEQSMLRRSYHSADFGYHAASVMDTLAGCLNQLCYDEGDPAALLDRQHDYVLGYEYRLAVRLAAGDAALTARFQDAMLGDNNTTILTRKMILAILISGGGDLLGLLVKLLLAARLQEGLRQAILESADAGGLESFIAILKVCVDNDLFRYSSALRAFDVWTGLGYGDTARPAMVKQYAALALDCLTDAARRREQVNSPNNLEAYLALWAAGCHDVADTDALVRELLNDEKPYRRALGWYYVGHMNNTAYRMRKAAAHLDERDPALLAWVTSCLTSTRDVCYASLYGKTTWAAPKPVPNADLPADKAEREALFGKLEAAIRFIGSKSRVYTGSPFEFSAVTLEADPVFRCLLSLAAYDLDPALIARVMALRGYANTTQRCAAYVHLLDPYRDPDHRALLREALDDRSPEVREMALKTLEHCALNGEDIAALCAALRTKRSSLRKSVVALLGKQTTALRAAAAQTLLAAPEDSQIQAGIELLLALREEDPAAVAAAEPQLAALRQSRPSTQTQILLDQLTGDAQAQAAAPDYTAENGWGLYDPAAVKAEGERLEKAYRLSRPALLTAKQIRAMLPTEAEVLRVIGAMCEVFKRHAGFEYEEEYSDGHREKKLFGEEPAYQFMSAPPIPAEYGRPGTLVREGKARLDMVLFHEEFRQAMGEYADDSDKWLGFAYTIDSAAGDPGQYQYTWQPWYQTFLNSGMAPNWRGEVRDKYRVYGNRCMAIFLLGQYEFDRHTLFRRAMQVGQSMMALLGEEHLGENERLKAVTPRGGNADYMCRGHYAVNSRPIAWWRTLARQLRGGSAADWRQYFLLAQHCQTLLPPGFYVGAPLSSRDLFCACGKGVISRGMLFRLLLEGRAADAGSFLKDFTTPGSASRQALLEACPWADEVLTPLCERIVEVEQKRGELPTPLTPLAGQIQRFAGARYFCGLLAALGRENFYRGYAWRGLSAKQEVLSRLLKVCRPAVDDTPEALAALLKQTDISDKRLAEAAVYAPQWAAFAERILGWPGFKKAVWFFHAHISERFSAEKETEAAIYSPITPQQFNDGAFDKDWFLDAYTALGEKRFQTLYKAAKYITDGSNAHRRSQLYADAALGRLEADALRAEIADKRSQEKLRAYPLLPLPEGKQARMDELLRRYTFIQQFLKQSRQFGAQRRASEGKAVQAALENLAVTAGLGSVDRLTWLLESEQVAALRPLIAPQPLDETTAAALVIDEAGDAAMAVTKNGKPLKTLPKALAKHETVLALKETVKALRDQKSRARQSLERAMVDGTELGVVELANISGNPVLAPMLRALLWTDGGNIGFLTGTGAALTLRPLGGAPQPVGGDAALRLAHPHDLRTAGVWADYMRLLYDQKLVQPFKQVFREYYPLTEDERQERTLSRRYAGHQVQPQRTVALLRGRGWTVDYEEGLQRVCYKQNLIVRMYALADWFSPADIEAPTLETVEFFDRSTGENVPLEDVPPILFSEVMRDIDLVVSVAHVGGVDPEASHSTVELRVAVAKELLRLLKLGNVEFAGTHHARIHGRLADYSVHMGSGVVHAEGRGMLAILPVHSQARGRIFLPFADDDPKTAEILSKIILLAEDTKIRDPEILRQITG